MLQKKILSLSLVALAAASCLSRGAVVRGPALGGHVASRRLAGHSIGTGRLAVRNECWLALDGTWSNPNPDAEDQEGPRPTREGSGYISRQGWAYIVTDGGNNALERVLAPTDRGGYGGYATNIIPGTHGSLMGHDTGYWIGRVVSDDYALGRARIGDAASRRPDFGHGLQCPSFASMVIYRATGGRWVGGLSSKSLPRGAPASMAKPGDLVFNPSIGTYGHTAICVRNVGGTITLVDSNWVGGDGQELIGRHDIPANAAGWYCYSGQGKWY